MTHAREDGEQLAAALAAIAAYLEAEKRPLRVRSVSRWQQAGRLEAQGTRPVRGAIIPAWGRSRV